MLQASAFSHLDTPLWYYSLKKSRDATKVNHQREASAYTADMVPVYAGIWSAWRRRVPAWQGANEHGG